MKHFKVIMAMLLAATLFAACSSSNDETPEIISPTPLYVIIKLEGAQLIDIMPDDYVLTLGNILAVKPFQYATRYMPPIEEISGIYRGD